MSETRTSPLKILAVRGTGEASLAPYEEWPVTVPVEWNILTSGSEIADRLPSMDILISGSFTTDMGRKADSLKAIMSTSTGYEGIDPSSVPPGCVVTMSYAHEIPIAEWVMMTAMVLDKELFKSDRTLRSGSWDMFPPRHGPFRELHGRTMGIVGFGHIGEQTASLATAFGMRCIATGRRESTPDSAKQLGVTYCSGRDGLERVLGESDFVVISTPLTDATRDLIGEPELSLMKTTSYIFNPARGAIINEAALFEALKRRRIAGAGLDAWYCYPNRQSDGDVYPANLPFWELDNVVMTTHSSAATFGTFERRVPILAENIDRLARGEPLLNVVPGLSHGQVP